MSPTFSQVLFGIMFQSHRTGEGINKSEVRELGEGLRLFGYIFLPFNFSQWPASPFLSLVISSRGWHVASPALLCAQQFILSGISFLVSLSVSASLVRCEPSNKTSLYLSLNNPYTTQFPHMGFTCSHQGSNSFSLSPSLQHVELQHASM